MQIEITAEFLKEQGWSKTFVKRFWAKVQKTDSCWLWMANKNSKTGYGMVGRGSRDSRMETAHRASWIIHKGPVPTGLHVLHNCPNGDCKSCVNPEHLWLGTQADNSQDAKNKGQLRSYFSAHPLIGTDQPNSKLSDDDIREIRQIYASGETTMERLGQRFGVTRTTVGHVVRRKTWRHIA